MSEDMTQILKRLDRFEDQLSEVRAAIVQMAKTEERVSLLLQNNTAILENQNAIYNRLSALEIENATQKQSIGTFERLSWIAIGAAASVAAWFARGQ